MAQKSKVRKLNHWDSKSVIDSYFVLPLRLPDGSFTDKPILHYLFLKEHEAKNTTSTRPTNRVLYATNLPIDTTESKLRSLFLQLGGRLDKIETHGKKTKLAELLDVGLEFSQKIEGCLMKSGANAHLHFVERHGLLEVLKSISSIQRKSRKNHDFDILPKWTNDKTPLSSGFQRYKEMYIESYAPMDKLNAQVESYMVKLKSQETAKALSLKRLRTEPDEEGWVTVTRGGRNGVGKTQLTDEQKQKKTRLELENFYRFQFREHRKVKAQELMKKFDQDKIKIEGMKQRRVFKPF